MVLHHQQVIAPSATPTRAVAFLHGILGSGSNLRAHARRFVTAHPEYMGVLIDLRAHGESLGVDGADTVRQAAADVLDTSANWGVPLQAVVGHSFGGKVALELAALSSLEDVVTLDSSPGPRADFQGSEAILAVLNALERVEGPWATRAQFVEQLMGQGLSESLGQWLAMNLRFGPQGFEFLLNLKRIHVLLDDYFHLDCWPIIERAASHTSATRFHLAIATESQVYGHDDRVRAQLLETQAQGQVTVDLISGGHWVHAENPEGVAQVLVRRLGQRPG